MVRMGNEGLVKDHPAIDELIIWDKKSNKNRNLLKIVRQVKSLRYDYVINLQRHFSTGLIAMFSGAKYRIGFIPNPLSYFYTLKIPYEFPSSNGMHEIERNDLLINSETDETPEKPSLFFSEAVRGSVSQYIEGDFVAIAPASVWFTKQFPMENWIDLINQINPDLKIYLLGAPNDFVLCNQIAKGTTHRKVLVLAGVTSLEQTSVIIKHALFCFVNDSAPLHMASAFNTPVCAIFCSTLPSFGFYPLSDDSVIIETSEQLNCRPCGLHGKKKCPEFHFKCGNLIRITDIKDKVLTISESIFK